MEIKIEIRSKVSVETNELIYKTANEAVQAYLSRSESSLITPFKIDGLFLVILIQDRLCKVLEAKDEQTWKEAYRRAQKQSNDPRMN
ncbi:MAG: hypothetical protein RH860_09105 [Cytophagales bacterium]